jgi:hypothetical protein
VAQQRVVGHTERAAQRRGVQQAAVLMRQHHQQPAHEQRVGAHAVLRQVALEHQAQV